MYVYLPLHIHAYIEKSAFDIGVKFVNMT
jgi:hypothetical protein